MAKLSEEDSATQQRRSELNAFETLLLTLALQLYLDPDEAISLVDVQFLEFARNPRGLLNSFPGPASMLREALQGAEEDTKEAEEVE